MTTAEVDPRPYRLRGGESWRSPWEDYRWLRDNDPVHVAVDPDFGEYIVLSRFGHVFDAVRDTSTFSSASGLTLDPELMKVFAGRAGTYGLVDIEDLSVRPDVERPPTGHAGRRQDAIGSGHILLRVGQDGKIRFVFFRKPRVGLGVVDADHEVRDVILPNRLAARPERLAFGRSTTSERLGKPGEHHGTAAVIRQLVGLAV